ncbi:hypothetical protein Pint_33846 [Pistacia integerrima]|uniref:Uncharacterized protein n=1 Tax=Pistacia integerrima TaxID=434235 RepID=A0ACC0X5R6_9ROSI|nr:hypothetical protein Pint_33846 [Pistacia integerrima]
MLKILEGLRTLVQVPVRDIRLFIQGISISNRYPKYILSFFLSFIFVVYITYRIQNQWKNVSGC